MLSLFITPPSISLGNGAAPQSVASGDFRGNGRLDVAVANTGANSLSVLLANGNGTFAAPVNYSLGAGMKPTFIASADLNGDAKPDLVVVDNASVGFVSILLNNGDGTFAAPVKYAVGANPTNVAVADMDGASGLDLVVTNKGDNSLTVLLNQGNGAFTIQAPFALPAAPTALTAGDFNNDGKNDVAVTTTDSNDHSIVYVFFGTGAGSFTGPGVQYAAGKRPAVIVAGSFHSPGVLDLAVLDLDLSSSGTDLEILLNNGSGVFASPVQYPDVKPDMTFAINTPNALAVGDLNGDGIADLAIANGDANNSVAVLLGHGDGSFGNLTEWVIDRRPTALVIGNFLGDGHADLAVVNQESNNISFVAGHGDGTFSASPITPIYQPGLVVTGDFNLDGKQDVIVGTNVFAGTNGPILTLFAGNGDGTFQAPTTIANITNPTVGIPRFLRAADLNGDHALDLLMIDNKDMLYIYFNNGHGVFAPPVVYPASPDPGNFDFQPGDFGVGDINGDGKMDVVIANTHGALDGTAMVYLNDGTGTLTLVDNTQNVPDVGAVPTSVAVTDLNGDGFADLAVTDETESPITPTNNVSVLLGNGDGTFQPKVSYPLSDPDHNGGPISIAAAPLRPGGKPDLAVGTFFGPGLDILLNNGDGTFGPSTSLKVGTVGCAEDVIICDVTRDGIPDVVVPTIFDASITVWPGLGDGTFAPVSQTLTVGNSPDMTAAADFNGDGFLDLVSSNGTGGTISFFLTGPAAPTVAAAFDAPATYHSGAQNVTLNATVTTLGPVINEGTLTFTVLQGANTVGTPITVNVVNGAASASYALPAGTAIGSYIIQAAFNGTANFASSLDASHALVVGTAPASTSASAASATFNSANQNVSFTATVSSSAGVVNEGTETFTLLSGATIIGTPVTVNVANGAAAASYVVPGGTLGGAYTIQAVYNGTDKIAGSTDSSHALIIHAAATNVAAASLIADFRSTGQNVALSATVTSGAGVVNEGTMTFTVAIGGVPVGSPTTVNVANGAASANYALPGGTAAGTYVITAAYNGTGNYAVFSENAHTLTINPLATSTSAAPATTSFQTGGHSVSLQATITSATETINAGTATFTILSGATPVGSAMTANVANGAASVNYTLPAGTAIGNYTIQVVFNGTGNFQGSSDNSHSLTISGAVTSTAASNATASFSTASQQVSLSATVTSSAGIVNEGTETFTILQGVTVIGSPITVNVASGAASGNYTLPAGLAHASYTIQAVFNGSANFAGSIDNTHNLSLGVAHTATAAASATVGFSSASQTVSLSATVTSAVGTVNEGTETFTLLQGANTIGSPVTVGVANGSAIASFTLPAGTAVGSYVIQAVYNSAGNFGGSGDSNHSLTVASTGQIQFSNASFSANASDPTATITVTRTGGSFGAASVTFATGGGTAPAGTDYTATTKTINWAAGDQNSKTVTVPLINHNATGADTETIGLTLSQTSGAALGSLTSATLTIQETPSTALPSQLNFSIASAHVARNAGNAVLTIIRTGGLSGTVSVQVAASDGSAHAGTDYTAMNVTLTFGPNVTAQTISIPLSNNAQSGGKTINVVLSNPTGGAALLTPSSLLLTITDPLPVQPIAKNQVSIASAFTHDSQALSIFVNNAYHLYLKRSPDSLGLAFWVDQLQNQGLTDEKLETGFLSSTEYIQNHGGTGQAWVIGMYQDLLGRNPDAGGLTFWTGVLAKGGSAFSVALGFAASAEREGQRIAGDYQIFLGRPLDAAGQAFWVNQFLNGARNEDVVAGFVGSLEYYQNPNKGQNNRTAWLDAAFQDIYHRDPSASELAKWLGLMT